MSKKNKHVVIFGSIVPIAQTGLYRATAHVSGQTVVGIEKSHKAASDRLFTKLRAKKILV